MSHLLIDTSTKNCSLFFSKENKVIKYEIPVGKTYKTFEEIEQFSNKINSK